MGTIKNLNGQVCILRHCQDESIGISVGHLILTITENLFKNFRKCNRYKIYPKQTTHIWRIPRIPSIGYM